MIRCVPVAALAVTAGTWLGAGAAAASAPAGQLAPITVPPLTVPPLTAPAITAPPVTVPSLTVPSLPLPTITVPPLTGPTVPPVAPSTAPRPPAASTTPSVTSSRTVTVGRSPAKAAGRPAPTPGSGARYRLADLPADTRLAARTAKDLSMPLGLAVAVAVFLVVQGRVERSDPKVTDAPVGFDDDTVGFA